MANRKATAKIKTGAPRTGKTNASRAKKTKASPFLQVIFTTQGHGQFIGNFNWSPELIKTKSALVKFAYSALCGKFQIQKASFQLFASALYARVPMPRLAKLSCCIFNDGTKIEEPAWYIAAQGKVYFDENGLAK